MTATYFVCITVHSMNEYIPSETVNYFSLHRRHIWHFENILFRLIRLINCQRNMSISIRKIRFSYQSYVVLQRWEHPPESYIVRLIFFLATNIDPQTKIDPQFLKSTPKNNNNNNIIIIIKQSFCVSWS